LENENGKFLRRFVVEETFEPAGTHGMLELAYRFCLNLPDSLAGDFKDSADFFQRISVAVPDSVSQLDNLAFAV
jgi:hypothetical protein